MEELNNIAKTSVKGGFLLFIGMASSTIILAITSIIVSRILGPEKYGLYNISLIVPTFLISLADIGISPALTRFSALYNSQKNYDKVTNLIRFGISLKLIITLIISLFLFLFSENIAINILNRPNIGVFIRIGTLYLLGGAILNLLNSIFNGIDEMGKNSLLMNVQAILKAITSIFLILIGLGVTGALIGTGVGSMVAAAVGYMMILIFIYPKLQNESEKNEGFTPMQSIKLLIPYGAPIYLAAILLNLHSPFQRILLSYFQSNIVMGNYAIAMNFSSLLTVLTAPITMALFPAFSKLDIQKSRLLLDKIYKLSVKYTSIILIPVSLAIIVLSESIVYLIYGNQYQLASGYLSLYLLYFFNAAIGMYVTPDFLNSQGNTTITLRINLIFLGISFILACTLIPSYGALGLIEAILISQLISSSIGLYFIKKIYQINADLFSSLKILISSLFSALIVYIIINQLSLKNPILILTFGGITYVLSFLFLAPIVGAITYEDTNNFENFTNEIPIIKYIIRYIMRIEKNILKLRFSTIKSLNDVLQT